MEEVKAKVTVKQKITPEQEEAALAAAELERESADADATTLVEDSKTEVIPKEATLTISVSDFARIVADASNGRAPRIQAFSSQSDTVVERLMDNTLGAVGDGLHRVADGARDIVGGVIDIVTLGRTKRR